MSENGTIPGQWDWTDAEWLSEFREWPEYWVFIAANIVTIIVTVPFVLWELIECIRWLHAYKKAKPDEPVSLPPFGGLCLCVNFFVWRILFHICFAIDEGTLAIPREITQLVGAVGTWSVLSLLALILMVYFSLTQSLRRGKRKPVGKRKRRRANRPRIKCFDGLLSRIVFFVHIAILFATLMIGFGFYRFLILKAIAMLYTALSVAGMIVLTALYGGFVVVTLVKNQLRLRKLRIVVANSSQDVEMTPIPSPTVVALKKEESIRSNSSSSGMIRADSLRKMASKTKRGVQNLLDPQSPQARLNRTISKVTVFLIGSLIDLVVFSTFVILYIIDFPILPSHTSVVMYPGQVQVNWSVYCYHFLFRLTEFTIVSMITIMLRITSQSERSNPKAHDDASSVSSEPSTPRGRSDSEIPVPDSPLPDSPAPYTPTSESPFPDVQVTTVESSAGDSPMVMIPETEAFPEGEVPSPVTPPTNPETIPTQETTVTTSEQQQ